VLVVDRNGIRRAMSLFVLRDHHGNRQRLEVVARERDAYVSAGHGLRQKSGECGILSPNIPRVLDHPGHLFGRAAGSGDDEVALVFAALVVHDDYEFPTRYGCDCTL
jgi:hypothetical protein